MGVCMKKTLSLIFPMLIITVILLGCSSKEEHQSARLISNIEEETTDVPPVSEFIKLKGRGHADEGRNEPQYSGLNGFVVVGFNQVSEFENFKTKFPTAPWSIPLVKQVGPEKFVYLSEGIPHKTRVKVIKQMLTHGGHGFYNGALLVEANDDKRQFLVNVENFVTYPYWEDDISEAAKAGALIATYNGNGEAPVNRSGEWVDIQIGTDILVDNIDGDTIESLYSG